MNEIIKVMCIDASKCHLTEGKIYTAYSITAEYIEIQNDIGEYKEYSEWRFKKV